MKYRIKNEGSFPTVTISKIRTDEEFYAERNSCIACSPLFVEEDAKAGRLTGQLQRKSATGAELEGASYKPPQMPTFFSRTWANFVADSKVTIDRKYMGEKSYVLHKSLEEGQKATFRSCFPGTIMAWDATPLEDGEVYLEKDGEEKSVESQESKDRPHGTLLVVRGAFLLASSKIVGEVWNAPDPESLIVKASGTGNAFQRFSGDGFVFLEVHGGLQEIPLEPNESVDVFPGYLLGFTEGVKLEMKSAGNMILRNDENNDYVIRLTADDKGGYVYTHSVRLRDFFMRDDVHAKKS